MSRVVVVTGVPGSGKSTVVNEALERLRRGGVDYRVVNYGDVMLELMRGEVIDRDEMRKVPTDRYREIQRKAGKQIAELAKEKPVLVDTHCLIRKPEGYYPGLPLWVLEELKPGTIIIVEAGEEEIARRRLKDVDRKRDRELLEEIKEHQQLNRAIAMAYAAFSGAAVRLIQNRDGRLNEAVDEMVSAMG